MFRVFTDFNELSVTERAWLLLHEGQPLAVVLADLGLQAGDRILLFQDERDFDVEGVLAFGPANAPASDIHPVWYAQIDWTTLRYF